jgi:hypothetical protein
MPSVGPMTAGFKQVPAGGYMTVISTLQRTNMYAAPVKTGSGGAATVAAPVAIAAVGVYNAMSVGPGSSLKDMGSVLVSSGRMFRKFKAVASQPAAGTGLGDVATTDSNFGTFYLEVAADGGDVPDGNKSILARSF